MVESTCPFHVGWCSFTSGNICKLFSAYRLELLSSLTMNVLSRRSSQFKVHPATSQETDPVNNFSRSTKMVV